MKEVITPPATASANRLKTPRNSNLELYRIIVMLLIVAHHYVVNSGLFDMLRDTPLSASSATMLIFGAWGKTGINCFVLITGWFMCKSHYSWNKFIKLYLQIAFYAILIYGIFCFTEHEQFNPVTALLKLVPIRSLTDGFVSCFLVFFLLIPVLNVMIQGMSREMYRNLVITLLTFYSLLPNIPSFHVTINYVGWFCILYLLAAYIRLYGLTIKASHRAWGFATLFLLLAASMSILAMHYAYQEGYVKSFIPYFFISDSNKLLSLAIAVTSFMYFKDLRIPHSHLINAIGGATFGVLLIHANSDAMRQWLWRETVDCVGHFGDSIVWTLAYASMAVLIIFTVCAVIDWSRGRFIEPHILKLINRFTSSQNIAPTSRSLTPTLHAPRHIESSFGASD